MSDLFSLALAHHRRGELQQAGELYQQILAQDPHHSDALHLFGVVLHQVGQHDDALPMIRRAIEIQPQHAIYHCNLAEVHRALRQPREALECCRTALQLQPNYFEAHLNMGLAHLSAGQAAEAEAKLRDAIALDPHDARGHCYLAECLIYQNRRSEALDAYETAISVNPQHGASLNGLGHLLMTLGAASRALGPLRRAVELLPKSAIARANLARCHIELGRLREGLALYDDAMQLDPTVPEICVNIGHAWIEAGDLKEAEGWFRRALRLQPGHPVAIAGFADVMATRGQHASALPQYDAIVQQCPDCVAALAGMARSLREVGDHAAAVQCLQRLVEMQPESSDRRAELGLALAAAGDIDAATAHYRTALEKDPQCARALAGLATALRDRLPPPDRDRMIALLPATPRIDRRADLAFGLARVLDAAGDHARAAEHWLLAHEWRKKHAQDRGQAYDPESHTKQVDAIVEAYSKEFFKRVRNFGAGSDRPAFLVGMPGGGAEAIEQHLLQLPNVASARDRRLTEMTFHHLPHVMDEACSPIECVPMLSKDAVQSCASWHLQQLDQIDEGKAARILDRMLESHLYLGFIATMFPQARIIHCRNDLRDVAAACFMIDAPGLTWNHDLESIGRRILDYVRLMDHWRKVLPTQMLEIDYAAFLARPDFEGRRVISWLGLPHTLPVKKSTPEGPEPAGRWKPYEALLAPVIAMLPKELLK